MHGTRTVRRWRTLIAAFLFGVLGVVTAQAQTWEWVYGPVEKTEAGRRGVIPVQDNCWNPNGYISVGFSDMSDSGDMDVYVVRTDVFGNRVWEFTYDITGDNDIDSGWAIWPIYDSIYYSYYDPETGEIITRLEGRISHYVITGVTQYVDEDGVAGDMDAFILKIDCNGGVVWSKTYGRDNMDEGGRDIIVMKTGDSTASPMTHAGDIAICGWADGRWSDGYILRTNSMGVPIWDGHYNSAGPDYDAYDSLRALTELKPNPGERAGDIIAVGCTQDPLFDMFRRGWAHRVNGNNGNVVASAKYGTPLAPNDFYSVIELQDPAAVDPITLQPNVAIVGAYEAENQIFEVQLLSGNPNTPRVEHRIQMNEQWTEYGLDIKEITFNPYDYDPNTPARRWDLAISGFLHDPWSPDPGDALIIVKDKECAIRLGQHYTANLPNVGREDGWSLYPVKKNQFGDTNFTYGFVMCGQSDSWDPPALDHYLVKTRSNLTTGPADVLCSLPYDPLCYEINTRISVEPSRYRIELYQERWTPNIYRFWPRNVCPVTLNKPTPLIGSAAPAQPLDVAIAPNPVQVGESLTVQIITEEEKPISVTLSNGLGEIVKSYDNLKADGAGNIAVPTNGLTSGAYNVTLRAGKERVTVRVIVIE